MLSVQEALEKVQQHVRPLEPRALSLGPGVLGLPLAEDISADLDMPPYDKAMMDGYAVRAADLTGGQARLQVIEEVIAGAVPRLAVGVNQATRIMTGAPVPDGADAVVMVERTKLTDGDRVAIDDKHVKPGSNIMRRGQEMRAGQVVLAKGTRLRPQELGVLATVGRTEALLQPAPSVAVLATGNEIVEAPAKPGPGQIRNGNGPMLMAQVARAGGLPTYVGLAPDETAGLRAKVADGLKLDVLLITGGVSAGKLDLVPGVLADLGVEPIFHKVTMKPGKPVFFGVHRRRPGAPGLVFGLPGNPVSAMVCFALFARPALRGLMGREAAPSLVKAKLTTDFPHRGDRPTYHPANLAANDGCLEVRPVSWFGSPDLRSVTAANAFVVLPPGDLTHKAGTIMDVLAPDLVV